MGVVESLICSESPPLTWRQSDVARLPLPMYSTNTNSFCFYLLCITILTLFHTRYHLFSWCSWTVLGCHRLLLWTWVTLGRMGLIDLTCPDGAGIAQVHSKWLEKGPLKRGGKGEGKGGGRKVKLQEISKRETIINSKWNDLRTISQSWLGKGKG